MCFSRSTSRISMEPFCCHAAGDAIHVEGMARNYPRGGLTRAQHSSSACMVQAEFWTTLVGAPRVTTTVQQCHSSSSGRNWKLQGSISLLFGSMKKKNSVQGNRKLNSSRRNSMTWFCCIMSKARFRGSSPDDSSVGPNTMARFWMCMRFLSLCSVTLRRCLSRYLSVS